MTIIASKEYSLQCAAAHHFGVNEFRVRESDLHKVPYDACAKMEIGFQLFLSQNTACMTFMTFLICIVLLMI